MSKTKPPNEPRRRAKPVSVQFFLEDEQPLVVQESIREKRSLASMVQILTLEALANRRARRPS